MIQAKTQRILTIAIKNCLNRGCNCALTYPLEPNLGCPMYFIVPRALKASFTEGDLFGIITLVALGQS